MTHDSGKQTEESKVEPNELTEVPASPVGIRVLRTLFVGTALSASLICFPALIPWSGFFWAGWGTVSQVRGRVSWTPWFAGFLTLALKCPPWIPSLWGFALAMLAVAVLEFRESRNSKASAKRNLQCFMRTIAVWVLWGIWLWQWSTLGYRQHDLVLDSRPIVCLGDSLTDGFRPDLGYPDALGRLVSVPVVNLGMSGISSRQGLGQIDRVLGHQPQLVIVELGGHDFLKAYGRRQTKRNLLEIIQRCREQGAEVLLMEIPRGFMVDPYFGIEREIAYQYDVPIVSDTWLREVVLMSPIAPPGMWMPRSRLSDDGIHSNPRGSRRIARRVLRALVRIYGPAVLKPSA